jgi:hypothetical protein
MSKKTEHQITILLLEDHIDDSDSEPRIDILSQYVHEPKKLLQWVQNYLHNLKPEICPNCGGMLPEFAFEYEGKTYFFTCYMITGKGKIATTDYRRFGKYCQVVTEQEKKVTE